MLCSSQAGSNLRKVSSWQQGRAGGTTVSPSLLCLSYFPDMLWFCQDKLTS